MAKPAKEWGGVSKGITIFLPSVESTGIMRVLRSEGYQTTVAADGKYDAVLFTGWGPISPILYGESPIFGNNKPLPNYLKDRREWRILRKIPRHIPKIGIGRGAHLLNAYNGGSSLQDVSGHCHETGGRYTHQVKLWTGDIFEVVSDHFQMMVPAEDAFVLGNAQKSYYKKSDQFDKKYTREERLANWDDPELIHYWYTNSFCFEPDPVVDKETEAFFGLMLHEFFQGRME